MVLDKCRSNFTFFIHHVDLCSSKNNFECNCEIVIVPYFNLVFGGRYLMRGANIMILTPFFCMYDSKNLDMFRPSVTSVLDVIRRQY